MREMGLFGVTIPEAYGGLGLDLLTYIGIIEELAYGWMTLTGIINTHTMAATLIMTHGTEEQKQRWLPTMATGERRGALSLSEPDAGSDTRNISCRATPDGDEYVLNGTKAWVTNGERASIVALAARTDEGISAFIVEKEPGPVVRGHLRRARTCGKLGYKGVETVEMAYADHRIPAANLLGEAGPGPAPDPQRARGRAHQHRVARRRRRPGRLRRRASPTPSSARPWASRSSSTRPSSSSSPTWPPSSRRPACSPATPPSARAAGLRCDVEAGMAKLFASETALEIATEAMRIHGGMGYTTELPVERYYRDAPLMIIGEGTNEIQRIVITRGLLARARERG